MAAVVETPVWRYAGFVNTMNGIVHSVVKSHGFGTAPGTSEFPGRSSPVTLTRKFWHWVKFAACVSVRRLSPMDHDAFRAMNGVIVQFTVAVSIASLKSTTMGAARRTSTSPWKGLVETISGGVHAVVNVHGLDTRFRPLLRGLPTVSAPAVTSTVTNAHSGNGAAWLIVSKELRSDQESEVPIGGLIVYVTVPMFISSLNRMRIGSVRGTLNASGLGMPGGSWNTRGCCPRPRRCTSTTEGWAQWRSPSGTRSSS